MFIQFIDWNTSLLLYFTNLRRSFEENNELGTKYWLQLWSQLRTWSGQLVNLFALDDRVWPFIDAEGLNPFLVETVSSKTLRWRPSTVLVVWSTHCVPHIKPHHYIPEGVLRLANAFVIGPPRPDRLKSSRVFDWCARGYNISRGRPVKWVGRTLSQKNPNGGRGRGCMWI